MKSNEFILNFEWLFRRWPIGPMGGGDKGDDKVLAIEWWCARWVAKSAARIGGIL